MGNRIGSRYPGGVEPLDMSNGLTAVVLDVLALAACDLAKTDWERRFARWLVRHDQSLVGRGAVDVDLVDLGWTSPGFAREQRFVTDVLRAALRGHGWDRLPFEPNARLVDSALERLVVMVAGLDAGVVGLADPAAWTVADESVGCGVCDVHRVELHELGCVVCNDAPAERAPYRASRVALLTSRALEAVRRARPSLAIELPLEWWVASGGDAQGEPRASIVCLHDRHRDLVPVGEIYTTAVVTFDAADDVTAITYGRSRRGADGDDTLPP